MDSDEKIIDLHPLILVSLLSVDPLLLQPSVSN